MTWHSKKVNCGKKALTDREGSLEVGSERRQGQLMVGFKGLNSIHDGKALGGFE